MSDTRPTGTGYMEGAYTGGVSTLTPFSSGVYRIEHIHHEQAIRKHRICSVRYGWSP